MADPRTPRKPRRRSSRGASILMWIDRWMVQVSAGLVVAVWIVADATALDLSEGTKAALGSFVAYAVIKSKIDQKWRALEVEKAEMDSLVQALETSKPGSEEALEVRRELVALARRAQASGEEG